MAAPGKRCFNDPNFASVIFFLMRFSSECNIDELNIEELASMLENSDEVAPTIEDIHTKLLRKIRKTVPSGKWENVLAKFAYTYSMQDAWELERFGYKKSSLTVKLRILKALVESQVDRNVKFKNYINGRAAHDLREEPKGRDMFGNVYWFIMDKFSNIKIFRENPDDESWSVVASNRGEMVRLIEKLSSNNANMYSVKSPMNENSRSIDTLILSEGKSVDIQILNEDILEPTSHSQTSDIKVQKCLNKKEPDNVELIEIFEKLESNSTTSYNESDMTKNAKGGFETEQPAVIESEVQTIYSSAITESILVIQGQGNGEESLMGNVKIGDNTNATHATSHNTLPNIEPPLKKKNNKNYCGSVIGSFAYNKHKEESRNKIEDVQKSSNAIEGKTSLEYSYSESSEKGDIVKNESTSIVKLKTAKVSLEYETENVAFENNCLSPELNKKDKSSENQYKTSKNQENYDKQPKMSSITNISQSATRGKRGRKTRCGIVDGLDISHVIIDYSTDGSVPPVRQSRRIAQQKIKEETDRRLIEQKMLREMKKEAIKKKKKNSSHSDDEEFILSDSENSKNTTDSRTKMKKKSDQPWLSSTSESSSETEPEDDFIEHDNYDSRRSPFKSDHEFSPESDLETECIVPTKRARTVRAEGQESDTESVDSNLDHACKKCGKTDHPEWILLCDSCDEGYHCSCLTPVLFIIPEGDWFCPKCQHTNLIENLKKTLLQYDEFCSQFEIIKKHKNQEDNEECKNEECAEYCSRNGKESEIQPCHDKPKKDSYKGYSSGSSSSGTDEDDIPIYKLRRRNQKSNYRFNDYDDLINSAINRGIKEDNESISSGKDIRNIIKSNIKQETARSKSKSRSCSISSVVEMSKTNRRKTVKKKKLNNLDDTSDEDDESDTDFKDSETSTETENSFTEESESSLELNLLRKSHKTRNKYDMNFINDGDESDKSIYNIRKQRKKIQKILDDSDEFDEDEMTESEEINSADLCSDTETDSSHDKRRVNTKQTNSVQISAEKNTTSNRKRKVKKTEEDKAYRSGIKKKTKIAESMSSSSDNDKTLNTLGKRRTRGKKLYYILDDDFESSDDGITPGVQRPDTPPEERERFIKKQEEIKRMLAEKNTAAAKELATPKIKSLIESGESCKQVPLSLVPMQVIEGAKALDMDFLKSSKAIDSDDFDDELAVNFSDPDDVNEDDLAKIMEEEDFAQHQLKLDDEVSARKSAVDISPKKKVRDFDAINPSDITKFDKKSGGIEPLMPNYLPGKPNESRSYLFPNYPCVSSPPPVVCSSILQQMKQQAVPLQSCQQLIKFLPAPAPALSEIQYMHCPVQLASSVSLISNKVSEAAKSNLQKDVNDIRRRRRKKITPLRGELFKDMDDICVAKPVGHLHYHLPPNAHALESVATDYSKQTPDSCSSTHATECLESSEVDQRYSPGAYAPSSNILPRTKPAANINLDLLSSSSGIHEQPPLQSFLTLEPVNAEDQPESESTGNITADVECSSEFSGLVSYFSSQQNELNA